jgi:dCTP deaminase
MILSNRDIEKAIKNRQIIFDPPVDPSQFDSSSLNLRVGSDFRKWTDGLKAPSTNHGIDLDSINLSDLLAFTEELTPDREGLITIKPDEFVFVRTLEHVELPLSSKLAARVEGRSKQARLGMTAHITAPTIHAGFSGKIVLEIKNFGPFDLRVRPEVSRLCQLIFERVASIPRPSGGGVFQNQSTILGTPRKPVRSR